MEAISNTKISPPLWNLDWKGRPRNKDDVIQALAFFEKQSEWVTTFPEHSNHYFKLLSDTHPHFEDLSETAWKTFDTLLKNFPHLFPKCYPLSHPSLKQVQGILQAGIEYKLSNLAWWGLHRLKKDRKYVDWDNHITQWTWSIYASLQDVSFLESPGHIKLHSKNNLSIVPLLNSLMPIHLTIHDIFKRQDFEKMVKICPDVEKLTLFKFDGFNFKRDIPLLHEMKNLREFEWNHTFYSPQEVDEYLSLINPLEVPSLDLFFSHQFVTDEWLVQLSEKLPNLKHLVISSDQITTIPFKNLITLKCSNCIALKEISAPAAYSISCYNCKNLQKISAHEAHEINCFSCPSLEESATPKAKKIKYSFCQSLKSISTSNAKDIAIHACFAITEIIAPFAKSVVCTDCLNLKKIAAPLDAMVICKNCPSFEDSLKEF